MQFRSQTQTAAVGDAQGAVVVQSVTMATHRHWTPSSHGPPTFNPPVHGDPAAGQHRPMPSQKHWSLITRLSPWIVFPPSPVWSFAFHATLPNPVQLDFRLPPTLSARPSREPASRFSKTPCAVDFWNIVRIQRYFEVQPVFEYFLFL